MAEIRIDPDLLDAMEGILSLLNPGEYGVADTDPKAELIADLRDLLPQLSTTPVIIGGIAVILNGYRRQTADVDLLVARKDAMVLVRALAASGRFRKKKLDRWEHVGTGAGLYLCVEGELTHPGRTERFPSPDAVQRIPKSIMPAVALVDLMALKAKSGRAKDWSDFVCLAKEHDLDEALHAGVLASIRDPAVRSLVERWWEEARQELEREKNLRPSWGDES
jgi:hypothetical protein